MDDHTVRMPDFDAIARHCRQAHGVRVRRWRKTMSGCAWQTRFADGRQIRWIEAPRPRSPISLSIFLHEIGHHVVGFETYRHRCEEEFHAWQWALAEMRKVGVEPDARTLRRYERSMVYALEKATRRGIRQVPAALRHFSIAAA